MPHSQDQRTEQPTPQRRRQWRLRGHVARSAQLVGAVVLLGASAGLTMHGAAVAAELLATLEQQLEAPGALHAEPGRIVEHTRTLLGGGLIAVLPLLGLFVLLAGAANLLQFGLLVAPEAIKPQWSRLSPGRVWARTSSGPALLGLGLAVLKGVAVLTVAALLLWRELPALRMLTGLSPRELAEYTRSSLGWFALKISAGLCVLAVCDYALRRWRHGRSLRMTREELRDEERELEGDPLLRQRRRAARGRAVERRGDRPL